MQQAFEPEKASARTLEATVERIVFENRDSGWAVLRVRPAGGSLVTAVGRLPGTSPGERLRLTGEWTQDRKYGRQFRVDSFLPLAPKTLAGLRRYLASGIFPGIGKEMARRMVERFGDRTLEVLDRDPDRLAEVPGIGPVRRAKIAKTWGEKRGQRDALIFLQGQGLSATLATKVIKRYGSEAVGVVKKRPFQLAEDIAGVGFAAADQIARGLGIEPDAPQRAAAGVLFTLRNTARGGHVFCWRDDLAREAAEVLAIEIPKIDRAIAALADRRALVLEESPQGVRVFLPELLAAETSIAARARGLLAAKSPRSRRIDVERALAWFESRSKLRLGPIQRQAVARALEDRVLVITGGPGTGKTTLVRGVVSILRRKKQTVLLAAPTGRAANRLQEATGAEVRTVHRLLEFDPHLGVFRRDAERPLEADLVLVDEASMLDVSLAASLFEAIPDDARLVLVGDVDQLPSVGPGRVLADVIASRAVPVVRLTEIFRQSQASRIVINAHRILQGHRPEADTGVTGKDSDFHFIRRRTPEEVLDTLLHLVGQRIQGGFGLDPRREIQVLSPMRRGLLGTENLNRELQALLNPSGAKASKHGPFRIGDRVMQVRNNYDLDVFNGDVGRIHSRDRDQGRWRVDFDRRRVEYENADLEQLTLAYAATVHKAQGSEYPCVVLPLHTQHFMMLQRNLLYTAVTRASRLMILVGDPRALDIALRNRQQAERLTALAERLRSARRPHRRSEKTPG